MRRSLLTLTAIGFSAWSQPAPQQAQPPIVVQVQMPPTNPWVHLVELVVPGIIGAGLALFGVGLTNKHQRSLNETNHAYEIRKWHGEQQFQLKKEFYFTLIRTAYDLQENVRRYAGFRMFAKEHPAADNASQLQEHMRTVEQLKRALSCAISIGWIVLSKGQFEQLRLLDEFAFKLMLKQDEPTDAAIHDLLAKVVESAKRDLGYSETGPQQLSRTPGPEAKAESAT